MKTLTETIFNHDYTGDFDKLDPYYVLEHAKKGLKLGISYVYNALKGDTKYISEDLETLESQWRNFGLPTKELFEEHMRNTLEYVVDLVNEGTIVVDLEDFEERPEWWPTIRKWTKLKSVITQWPEIPKWTEIEPKDVTEVLLAGGQPVCGIIGISPKAKPEEIAFIKMFFNIFVP